MGRSNTANGGSTYYDLDIQVAATSDTSYTLRAVIYLTSFNVIDSVNSLSVTGNWSRSGALTLNGVYSHTAVWFQDIVVGRVYGSATNVSVSASWSNVEYWGTTLSASASYSVPARPIYPPGPPGLPSVDQVTGTSLRVSGWSAPTNNGGSAVDLYRAYVGTTSNFAPGTYVYKDVTAPPVTFTGLTPGTRHYIMVVARNAAGWAGVSGWSPIRTVDTLNYPSAPGTPYLQGEVLADQVTVNFTPSVSNGGSAIDYYNIQLLNSAGTVVQQFNIPGGPWTFSGLTAGVEYQVRVRAHNSVGFSAMSGVLMLHTTSGLKIRTSTGFVDAPVYVLTSTGFVPCSIYTRSSSGAYVA